MALATTCWSTIARLADVVIDCDRPAVVARFWAEALDGYAVAPYDDDELARLRSIGVDDPEDDPTVLVEAGRGSLRLWFQRVPEGNSPQVRVDGRRVKRNRVHLDLRADDQTAEVERLEALGARRIDIGQGDVTWVVMEDPEGNEFCVLSSRDT